MTLANYVCDGDKHAVILVILGSRHPSRGSGGSVFVMIVTSSFLWLAIELSISPIIRCTLPRWKKQPHIFVILATRQHAIPFAGQ